MDLFGEVDFENKLEFNITSLIVIAIVLSNNDNKINITYNSTIVIYRKNIMPDAIESGNKRLYTKS